MQKINLAEYRDRVLGCWTGKNIGGTLGGPLEGRREFNDVTFYTQKLNGKPAPNDDLDLQLIWLIAAEEYGLYRLNERILGEFWLTYITGHWNEYGVCKSNMRNGLIPPLSGSCNNDRWKFSNGAWIRSEIWACLFPASPDEAAQLAYCDACCDHAGEGIYAELFTASIESMAFAIQNIRKLIDLAILRIPQNCRVTQAVKLACFCYDNGVPFREARDRIVKDSEDLGWFQAPGNLGFITLALLYGEGDFERSICLAVNCGDDTDCTAGTVGAILGIIHGRKGIPKKWITPIGNSIESCSINTFPQNYQSSIPRTVQELTERVIALARRTTHKTRTLPEFGNTATVFTAEYLQKYENSDAVAKRIWNRSPYELTFDLPYGVFTVEYDSGPYVTFGIPKRLTVRMSGVHFIENVVSVKLLLPEEWNSEGNSECQMSAKFWNTVSAELSFTPKRFSGVFYDLPIEIKLMDRRNSIIVQLPLQNGEVVFDIDRIDQGFYDRLDRNRSLNMVR
jgi:hypothetical protein